MAVYAAHLTRTLQGNPSVFQVTAQEALGSTVKPALRKLIEYFAAVYPNKCGWWRQWYHELYLLFDLCLQYHYLKHYAASFSECFYGLLRVPISPSTEFSSGPRLPQALERGSLALLVLVPYLRDKLEQLVDRWREDLEDGRLGKERVDNFYAIIRKKTSILLARLRSSFNSILNMLASKLDSPIQQIYISVWCGTKSDLARKAAVKLYSIAYFVTESTKLIVLARYLTGKGEAPSLALHLLGLTLRDAPPEEPDENTWGDFFKNVFNGQLSNAVLTFPMACRAAGAAAQYGAFGVQLLRWWDARAPLALAALPTPPPPQKDDRAARWRNVCPVCLQRWKVPTVLPVSGFVFCYTCVSRHVRRTGACPATRLPASERTLVRLYLDT